MPSLPMERRKWEPLESMRQAGGWCNLLHFPAVLACMLQTESNQAVFAQEGEMDGVQPVVFP